MTDKFKNWKYISLTKITGDDDDEYEESKKAPSLAENTNTKDAMAVEKAKRDKIAEVIAFKME